MDFWTSSPSRHFPLMGLLAKTALSLLCIETFLPCHMSIHSYSIRELATCPPIPWPLHSLLYALRPNAGACLEEVTCPSLCYGSWSLLRKIQRFLKHRCCPKRGLSQGSRFSLLEEGFWHMVSQVLGSNWFEWLGIYWVKQENA